MELVSPTWKKCPRTSISEWCLSLVDISNFECLTAVEKRLVKYHALLHLQIQITLKLTHTHMHQCATFSMFILQSIVCNLARHLILWMINGCDEAIGLGSRACCIFASCAIKISMEIYSYPYAWFYVLSMLVFVCESVVIDLGRLGYSAAFSFGALGCMTGIVTYRHRYVPRSFGGRALSITLPSATAISPCSETMEIEWRCIWGTGSHADRNASDFWGHLDPKCIRQNIGELFRCVLRQCELWDLDHGNKPVAFCFPLTLNLIARTSCGFCSMLHTLSWVLFLYSNSAWATISIRDSSQ